MFVCQFIPRSLPVLFFCPLTSCVLYLEPQKEEGVRIISLIIVCCMIVFTTFDLEMRLGKMVGLVILAFG
jgi:hypothetical protein